MTSEAGSHKPLDRALRRFAERRRNATPTADLECMSAPAFRAVVAQRLRTLETELADVRLRINGLIFFTVGAVLVGVVERLLA